MSQKQRFILLVLLSSLLMIADDFLQQLYSPSNHAELELEFVFVVFILNACLWGAGQRWLANLVLGIFAGMQLLQLSHISYVGAPLTAIDLSKLFDEREEIGIAIRHALPSHWPVLLAWALPWGALFWLYNRYLRATGWKASVVCVLLVFVILGEKPYRATHKDLVKFMPGPTRSSLHNSHTVFSYYLVRMAFRKMEVEHPPYVPYQLGKTAEGLLAENILVFLSDSARYERQGLAGYSRDTTPRLGARVETGEMLSRHGIAASVATGSSLPLLFNVIREPGNVLELERGMANLFKQARQAGYKTFWLSTQESKLLNGLDISSIDVVITREDEPVDLAQKGDRLILDWLEEQEFGARNFIVVNTRTAHSPYADAYAAQDDFGVWPDGSQLPYSERQSNAYDNAMRFLDQLQDDSYSWLLQRFPGNSLWVGTSDHGQLVGEGGQWGHNRLEPEVASVPLVVSRHPATEHLPDGFVSHYQLGKWLLRVMGADLVNRNEVKGVHYLQSDKLYEDNLFLEIHEQGNPLSFCDVSMVSRYQKNDDC
jgi:glucan phosphoethanolaminetransferase (alkaline phosphatase superfamily)